MQRLSTRTITYPCLGPTRLLDANAPANVLVGQVLGYWAPGRIRVLRDSAPLLADPRACTG